MRSHQHASFVTLTYSDENLPNPPFVSKRDLQLFFKRLRKHLGFEKIRYFACGEYGEKLGRPHYHAIVYGLNSQDLAHVEAVYKSWTLGHVHFGNFNSKTAGYVAGYTCKKVNKHDDGREPEFTLMSRRPALGSKVLDFLKDYAFCQNRYDVLSCFRVGGRNFLLDRTIKNKLRQLTMSEEDIRHVKKLRLQIMQDEFFELVGEKFSSREKFLAKIDENEAAHWVPLAYSLEHEEKLEAEELYYHRRHFRKDL